MELVQDPGHSTSIMGVMKMGNIVPRVRLANSHLSGDYYKIITVNPNIIIGKI